MYQNLAIQNQNVSIFCLHLIYFQTLYIFFTRTKKIKAKKQVEIIETEEQVAKIETPDKIVMFVKVTKIS